MPARVFTGNRPTTSIMAPALTPSVLGQLIALYEHLTFVQGAVWGIDSFDQWGVELGKQLAQQLGPAVAGDADVAAEQDASTQALIAYYRSTASEPVASPPTDEPAARPARPPAAADRRPVRHGAVRRHRRPVAQEGHAGDLRPGQPRAAAAGLQPGRLRPPRLGRPGLRPDRARLGQGARPHRVPRGGLEAARRGLPVRARRLRRRRRLRAAAPHHRGARRGARHRRQPRVLPGDPAGVLRQRRRPAQGARARRRRRADSWRRVVIEKPFGHDLRVGARAQRDPRRGLPARLDLPDRPLPRQGDGPEHPGDAVRQRACSSRSGTPTTSTTCRSRWPRTSASAAGPATTTASAPPAT